MKIRGNMNYILKYWYKSKYFGFKRLEYKEFDSYSQIMIFILENKIKYNEYEIFSKVCYIV